MSLLSSLPLFISPVLHGLPPALTPAAHSAETVKATEIFVVTHLDSKIDDSDTAASEKLFSLFRHQR
jgi:hypothetical protein